MARYLKCRAIRRFRDREGFTSFPIRKMMARSFLGRGIYAWELPNAENKSRYGNNDDDDVGECPGGCMIADLSNHTQDKNQSNIKIKIFGKVLRLITTVGNPMSKNHT
jgi:hypothetical protein